ncbi:MAG: transporter substrate-binding domain-containing protein [Synergistaceae bacterium]|nr:transporter substrate-binding domain-containing protein [Synergistaceae bacterium]MBQ6908793.1 transporter substrate-binding domain-containing protein [Synergistaceae bacterium]MBQ9582419.1 transporter substrate-binding domain-containing protein [Synergistaceae bacterium]
MKKLLVLILVLVFASSAFAASETVNVGLLTELNITEAEFNAYMDAALKAGLWTVFTEDESSRTANFVFYDTLVALQLGLNKGQVDEIDVPEVVGRYILTANDNCKIAAMSLMSNPLMLALGFKDTKAELRDKVNAALKAMKEDNTLALLIVKYLNGPDFIMTRPIEFAKFDGAETIKVAVTGDLPPIDFIAPDGVPAGFNTAILAEIAKRLKVNLELVNIDANARAAALASERADVVLWFKVYQGAENQPDIPAGVILSDPYYSWDKFMHIKLKDK